MQTRNLSVVVIFFQLAANVMEHRSASGWPEGEGAIPLKPYFEESVAKVDAQSF
jgi:hypothetical protein